jgi:hypothetical protein
MATVRIVEVMFDKCNENKIIIYKKKKAFPKIKEKVTNPVVWAGTPALLFSNTMKKPDAFTAHFIAQTRDCCCILRFERIMHSMFQQKGVKSDEVKVKFSLCFSN